ncbi:MAG TPA: sugar ABC transporter ATP-binding protein [Gammaproteobacteria bacterium]|nr:sugar ABC transporter ATP-binding protein [Gammaproteobacteria bacterium]
MNASALLRIEGLSKQFPGVTALDKVDFSVDAGEVHALLGENGAGKSTLIKVLTGAYQKDAGTMEFEGKRIAPQNPAAAQRLGISTVYQEVNLPSNLSVAQNIFLGREPKRYGLIDWREIRRRSAGLLRRFELDIDVSRTLDSYPVAVRQLVAIARAVDLSARLLILDEPTASLDGREVERLFSILRQLKSTGVAVLFVTHFLDQVYAISDRITVLRNGARVGTFEARKLPRHRLIEHMLGKELQALEARTPENTGATAARPVLELRNLGARQSVSGLSFSIAPGEATGLSGLLGSGRSETCRLIFGLDSPDTGEILFRGKPVRPKNPRSAAAIGMGLCPEDRRSEGIIGALGFRENVVLALQARNGWWRLIPKKRQLELARKAMEEMKIAVADFEQAVASLSGGNQQKTILARWLATDPALLILDEPTRGIDIGAHAEILKLIRALCTRGMALLVASSELEEITAFSHKVVVLRDRAQVGQIEGAAISEQAILRAIAGGDAP